MEYTIHGYSSVIEGYSKRGGRRTILDGGEITNDNLAVVRLCQLAYRFTQNIKPRLSFLSVDNTTPHITFHGHPAIAMRYSACVERAYSQRTPLFSWTSPHCVQGTATA